MTERFTDLAGQPLTDQETHLLGLVAQGLTDAETGRTVHLSENTIKHHKRAIFAKLGVRNAPAAVAAGYERGLLVHTDPGMAADLAVARQARELGCRIALIPDLVPVTEFA